MGTVGPVHYRLRDVREQECFVVRLEKYFPVKRTPKGYWVAHEWHPEWMTFQQLRARKYLKFIVDTSIKKYCYPTIEEAINSFIRRKTIQQSKLALQLEQADCCVNNLDKLQGATVESFQQQRFGGVLLEKHQAIICLNLTTRR